MKETKNVSIEVSITSMLMIVGFLLGLGLLWKIRVVIFMIFLAFIINSAIRPVVDRLEIKKGVPRSLSVAVMYVSFFIILSVAMTTVIAQTVDQFTNFVSQLPAIATNLGQLLAGFFERTANTLNSLPGSSGDISAESLRIGVVDYFNNIDLSLLGDVFGGGVTGAISVINSVIYAFFGIFTVTIISVYMLIRKNDIYSSTLALLPPTQQRKYVLLLRKIEKKLGDWLRGQLFLMFANGFLTWLGLTLPSLIFESYNLNQFALLLAFVSAMFTAVPNFGPFIAGFLGIIIAAGSNPINPLAPLIYIIVLFALIQQIEGIFLVPNVMKRAVGLDPIVTIVSVIAAFLMFNIIGAVLIIPFLAMLQIIVQEEFSTNRSTTVAS